MQKVTVATRSIDNFGIFISSLCAVHCALTPLLLLSTTVVSINPELLETIEIPFLVVSAFVALFSVATSLGRHKNFLPLIFAISGLAFVLFGGFYESLEVVFRVTGSLLIIASHSINKRLFKAKTYEE